ncbi:MAG: FMN-binding glutamate synthase family protein [Gammaproteobacteria bacterium]|nr:FMN-binding glutamate synthase family protein [Gammaproteobacteria bacterium]
MAIRFLPFLLVVLAWLAAVAYAASLDGGVAPLYLLTPLLLLGFWDLSQTRHALQRNYPLVGHSRGLFESVRTQIRQYWVESDTDGAPFDREQRSLVYQRAKGEIDTMPFGTERNVYAAGYEWINHSMAPRPLPAAMPRVTIGGDQCAQPYDASVLNISAMSFGSLSAAAIRALNLGAQRGGFAHDTGEGGMSEYHLEHGGDLIWEIGSGYFGCRTATGAFDPQQFSAKAQLPGVKMIQVKLSQGAKPGHGGVLPAAKVSAEIARARGVPIGEDCVSPSAHSAFGTPLEFVAFLGKLRERSGGKPVGFKLCVGHKWEFLAICKAMLETEIYPDFIVVDGKEGGTGAAPVEFSDHVGMPRREGLVFVVNALVGSGIRERIRLGCSGKIITGFDMAVTMSLGTDWCNSARGFMFAVGCLQSQKCHTNLCPVGIATQDLGRQRALVVAQKAPRVESFHRHTVRSLMEIVAAAGLTHPEALRPHHISRRVSAHEVETLADAYHWLAPGALRDGNASGEWARLWRMARADQFSPV